MSCFLSSEFTFGAAKSHDQRAVAFVKLPEAGAAGSVSDDRQLSQYQSLLRKTQKKKTLVEDAKNIYYAKAKKKKKHTDKNCVVKQVRSLFETDATIL